jgi:hypothetical protein
VAASAIADGGTAAAGAMTDGGGIPAWLICPSADRWDGAEDGSRTRMAFRPRDFRRNYDFRRRHRRLCAGLCLHPRAMRIRCSPSSLYTFSLRSLARRCLDSWSSGGSPNLRRFTQELSQPGAQFPSPLRLPVSPPRHGVTGDCTCVSSSCVIHPLKACLRCHVRCRRGSRLKKSPGPLERGASFPNRIP